MAASTLSALFRLTLRLIPCPKTFSLCAHFEPSAVSSDFSLALVVCSCLLKEKKRRIIMFTPFGNKTGDVTASWRPEPRYRGTYSILSSCLVTMALCVWSAVHLNLPGASERSAPFWCSKQLWRKIGWVFLGIFAPEFVAWTAIEQHGQAITLTCDVKIWLEQPQSESFLRRLRRKIRGSPRSNQPNQGIRTVSILLTRAVVHTSIQLSLGVAHSHPTS